MGGGLKNQSFGEHILRDIHKETCDIPSELLLKNVFFVKKKDLVESEIYLKSGRTFAQVLNF